MMFFVFFVNCLVWIENRLWKNNKYVYYINVINYWNIGRVIIFFYIFMLLVLLEMLR